MGVVACATRAFAEVGGMKGYLWFWGLVNVALLGGIFWAQRPELPQPFWLNSITVGEVVLDKSALLGDEWRLDGQTARADLVQILRKIVGDECWYAFPEAEFSLSRHNPRHFKLNQHEYIITSHNAYLQAHYVHHDGGVYLCHERLKSLIATPKERWLP